MDLYGNMIGERVPGARFGMAADRRVYGPPSPIFLPYVLRIASIMLPLPLYRQISSISVLQN